MIPQGVEIRSELQLTSEIMAFGFRVADDAAVTILVDELLDYINKNVEATETRYVIVDMQNVKQVSSASISRLSVLHRKLGDVSWKLILLISDPIVRGVISGTELDRNLSVVADEKALHKFVETGPFTSNKDARVEFTEEELAQMNMTDITLDEAIRAVEQLRG